MSEPEEKTPGIRLTIFYLAVFIAAILALVALVNALGKADGSSETYLQTLSIIRTAFVWAFWPV